LVRLLLAIHGLLFLQLQARILFVPVQPLPQPLLSRLKITAGSISAPTTVIGTGGGTSGVIAAWSDSTGGLIHIAYGGGTNLQLIVYNPGVGSGAPVSAATLDGTISSITGYANAANGVIWANISETSSNFGSGTLGNFNTFLSVQSFSYNYSGTTVSGLGRTGSIMQATGTSLRSKGSSIVPGSKGGAVLASTGSVDPATSSTTQYAQPTYIILDHLCRVVGNFNPGQAPPDSSLYAIGTSITPVQAMLPSIIMLSTPSAGIMQTAVTTYWQPVVEGFNVGLYTSANLNQGGTFTIGGIGPPNIVGYRAMYLALSTSALAFSPGFFGG
jgi:hypothetical protein